jgi:predicted O-methyltransferase YrrM
LKGRKLDFLLIDGDHTYYGVKKDFEMYSKLVKKGGMIAFHDACVHPSRSGCEVAKFWRDIKGEYKHVEIIKDQKQGWAGIGILHINHSS